MTLGFVVLAPALTVGMVALLCLIFALGYVLYIKPLLDWLSRNSGGFFKKIVFWPVRKAAEAVNRYTKEHVALLMRSYVNGADPIVVTLLQVDDVTKRIAGTLGDMAEQTWQALWVLNHETIPRKISTALIPLRNQLDRHTARLDTLEDLNRQVAVEFGDALRALPWGVPGGYVTNIGTLLGTYAQLWQHYWNTTRAQLNTLLGETIPEIRQRLEALERGAGGGIGGALQGLRNRVDALERWRETIVMPRLQALTEGLDALSDEVFGPVAGGLTALLERVGELERQLREDVAERFTQLEAGLAQLRTELETGIETGLELFRERIEALELQAFTHIPQQLAAMQLAIDTIAAEIFDEVGAGLTALTQRVLDIETRIGTIILPQIELLEQGLEALREQITGNIIPRITAIEDILAPAAFGAFVLAALRISAPYLFCTNVVNAAKETCAAPADRLDELLLGAFALIGGISIIELARELQGITALSAAAIDTFVIED